MTFVFPLILGGLAVIGVPILLHLIMRQKPKRLLFPAFRFLLQRQRTNQRKIRLRHLVLLTLRVLLLAGLCLALARPRFSYSGLRLSSDHPVAAIFVLDSSYSMAYRTSDQTSRLEEARKRALEVLDELPEGSQVAILDTAEAAPSRGAWLASLPQARERISAVQLRPANASVSYRLEDALRLFADLARGADNEEQRDLPRLLCIFSDRTRAAWEPDRLPRLYDLSDQVAPTLPGLQQVWTDLPALVDRLKELRTRIPPQPGLDYPEQALIEALGELREWLTSISAADLPPVPELAKVLERARFPARTLRDTLRRLDKNVPDKSVDYRDQLLAALESLLNHLRGYHVIFVDVGVDTPVDLAITELELPTHLNGQTRHVFDQNEKIIVRAHVRATGKDYNATAICRIGKKDLEQAILLKAGEKQSIPFVIASPDQPLEPGTHQVEVGLKPGDLLAFNNTRYASFAIRRPRRVLLLTEQAEKAEKFREALLALRFAPDVRANVSAPEELLAYKAVFLLDASEPPEDLWKMLAVYVNKGGGLGIVPGGKELKVDYYNQGPAQGLMPGKLKQIVTHEDPKSKSGAIWNLDRESVFQHPMLKPFRQWRDEGYDLVRFPRWAKHYWEVEPLAGKSAVLVSYADGKNRPALLERPPDPNDGRLGRAILFTTTMDVRDPPWNDYMSNSFYVVLVGLATQYLAGETQEPILNFTSGRGDAVVRLPLVPRFPGYSLRGPDLFEPIPAGDLQSDIHLKQAVAPGHYVVEGFAENRPGAETVARFSVNIPAEESDLSRVPPAEIEALLGPGAVTSVERRAKIHDALKGYWNQPIDLFPFLMIAILFFLAVENLLANKFYKSEPAAEQEPRAPREPETSAI
jgi:hypothetical protein